MMIKSNIFDKIDNYMSTDMVKQVFKWCEGKILHIEWQTVTDEQEREIHKICSENEKNAYFIYHKHQTTVPSTLP